MGAIAKKAIGIMVTATAAAMVRMLIDDAKVESVHRPSTANDPTMSRREIAEASAMMNWRVLRRRSSNPEFAFWSDMEVSASRLSAVVGMKFPTDVCIRKSPAMKIRGLQLGCGGEFSKKRSATLGSFAMRVREIECAVLR
jgi:hypothetical protein